MSEESERKRRQLEAEIEDKRREQERAHEKITSMMMSVIQNMWTMQYRLPEISPLSTSTTASPFTHLTNTCIMHLSRPPNVHVHKQATLINHGLHDDRVVSLSIIIIGCTLIWTYYRYMCAINSPCSLWKASNCLKPSQNLF